MASVTSLNKLIIVIDYLINYLFTSFSFLTNQTLFELFLQVHEQQKEKKKQLKV